MKIPKGGKGGKKVTIKKSKSRKITNESRHRTVKGDLLLYDEDLKPKGYDDPKLTVIVSENKKQHQHGIIRLMIEDKESGYIENYLIHMDGLLSCIYGSYAKNLNAFRKPTIRQRVVKIHSFFKKLRDKLRE